MDVKAEYIQQYVGGKMVFIPWLVIDGKNTEVIHPNSPFDTAIEAQTVADQAKSELEGEEV